MVEYKLEYELVLMCCFLEMLLHNKDNLYIKQ